MRGHYTPKARASIPHQYLPAGNIPQKCILKAYKKGKPKKKDIRLATEEWKVLTPHGGYELLAEIHQVLKDGLWLLWPSDTIHTPPWAHMVNVEQWKRNAMWFSLGWDRRSLSSKRGLRWWLCSARTSAAFGRYHLWKATRCSDTRAKWSQRQLQALFSKSCFRKQTSQYAKELSSHRACTKPFVNI